MAYTDYIFYETEYHGSVVKDTEFDKWLQRAEMKLDNMTNGNITADALAKYGSQIQMATCILIDSLYQIDEAKNTSGMVKSISSGGESVTYADSARAARGISSQANFDVRCALLGTGLLYGGL